MKHWNEVYSLKEGIDYEFVELENNKIGIKFDGLTFDAYHVKVNETEEGIPLLSFNYEVIEDAEVTDEHEQKLGMILEKLLRYNLNS